MTRLESACSRYLTVQTAKAATHGEAGAGGAAAGAASIGKAPETHGRPRMPAGDAGGGWSQARPSALNPGKAAQEILEPWNGLGAVMETQGMVAT